MSDSFTPKLGRIGWKQGTRLDRYINKVMRAAQSAGHVYGGRQSGFTGSHIGRGSAFGTLAAAGLYPGGPAPRHRQGADHQVQGGRSWGCPLICATSSAMV